MEFQNEFLRPATHSLYGLVPAFDLGCRIFDDFRIKIMVWWERGGAFCPHVDGQCAKSSLLYALFEKKVFFTFGVKGPHNGNSSIVIHHLSPCKMRI
jgi:hypothetical protein